METRLANPPAFFAARRIRLALSLAIIFFALIPSAFAMPEMEKMKIDYLLSKVESSDLTFIRNGKSYTGKNARAHLQKKLDYVGNRIQTADDFIKHIANGSSVTGKPYYVKTKDGKKMEAEKWLQETLEQMPGDD